MIPALEAAHSLPVMTSTWPSSHLKPQWIILWPYRPMFRQLNSAHHVGFASRPRPQGVHAGVHKCARWEHSLLPVGADWFVDPWGELNHFASAAKAVIKLARGYVSSNIWNGILLGFYLWTKKGIFSLPSSQGCLRHVGYLKGHSLFRKSNRILVIH